MPSERANQLLAKLPEQHGDADATWNNRDAGHELGALDRWGRHYGVVRGGYAPSSESMHGSKERKQHWLARRESDESFRERVRKAIEDPTALPMTNADIRAARREREKRTR